MDHQWLLWKALFTMLVTGESRGFTELGQLPLCIQSLQKTVYDVKVTKNITFLLGKLVHHTHTHSFNGPFSGTTQVSRYQKGKTSLDFTGARDSEWQWHQLGHMQVCTLLQPDNHASTPPPLSFLQAGCPSCHPTNSVKALKASLLYNL